MSTTISIDELRLGMFIHLDKGWWGHPFARSSFLLTSQEQIGRVRSLGLSRLRWSPERSEVPSAVPVDVLAPERDASVDPDRQAAATAPVAPMAAAVPAPGFAAAPAHRPTAAAGCQRQYDEAAKAWGQITQLLASQPQQARQAAETATQSLLDGMLDGQELCLRVLPDGARDHDTLHGLNVTVLSMLLGHAFGFGRVELADLGLGALLHDIGKLDLPLQVRHLRPDFSHGEYAIYRSHVTAGVAHAGRMGLNPAVTAVIAQHHEMVDGSGFPERRSADRTDTAARIVAMVDGYDTLCNPRDPKAALTPHEAMSRMFAQSQTKFEVSMVNALIRMLGVYPPGSLVQLTDDRFALVHSVNTARPMKPWVVVANPARTDEAALMLDLDSRDNLGIRRGIQMAQVPAKQLSQLSPRTRIAYFFEPAQPDTMAT